MHQSQHSRTLSAMAAQQALLQQNQQQQQQQQQSHPQLSLQQQFLANPCINPYNLQLVYGNPAFAGLNASALAQAQLQAALASRTMPPQLMMPWVKVQQDRLEKEIQLSQQQAFYSALWRNKPPEGLPGYPLYRSESTGNGYSSGNTSPKVTTSISPNRDPEKSSNEVYRNDKPQESVQSPKADSGMRYPHSSLLPRSTNSEHTYSNKSDRNPSKRGDAPYRPPSPHAGPILTNEHLMKEREKIIRRQQEEKRRLEEDQTRKMLELERQSKREEEILWRAKYMKQQFDGKEVEQIKTETEKGRPSEMTQQKTSYPPHSRYSSPSSIAQTPFCMIDPATYMAAHASRFISDETVRMNEPSSEERLSSSPAHSEIHRLNRHVDVSLSAEVSVTSSNKIWKPPVDDAPPDCGNEKLLNSPNVLSNNKSYGAEPLTPSNPPFGWPYKYYVSTEAKLPTNPNSMQSAVYNIHSLKYSPSTVAPGKVEHSPKSFSDKGVVVKPSPGANHGENQVVKYISDRDPTTHKPQHSPERLGPLMPDGSRARILTTASLNSLYHFPGPSSRSLAKMNQETNPVIINGGHYRVTEVKGKESVKAVTSSPSHVVYKKPLRHESSPLSFNQRDDVRMGKPHLNENIDDRDQLDRNMEENGSDQSEQGCHDDKPSATTSLSSHHTIPNLPASPSIEPHLRSLAAAGYFNGIFGSNVIWGDLSNLGNHNPGAPSKGAVKDALLGFGKDNVLNLSTNKSPKQSLLSSDVGDDRPPLPHSSVMASIAENTAVVNSQLPSVNPCSAISREQNPSKCLPLDPAATPISCDPPTIACSFAKVPMFTSRNVLSLGSDTSGVSEHSWSKLSGDTGNKSSCSKLKKAWLKRMSDGCDDAMKTSGAIPIKRKSSSDFSNSPSSTTTADRIEDLGSISANDDVPEPPAKKLKKKHKKQDKEKKNKDPNKKKRKHRETKKLGKFETEILEVTSAAGDDETAVGGSISMSNSKLHLIRRFVSAAPPEGKASEHANNVKKLSMKYMKSPARMPLGENGLPVSVLSCKKEQARLRGSGDAFVQDAACHEISAMNGISILASSNGAPSLPKCRECRSAKRKENKAVFCRFYGFRKLSFINGQLQAAGFCEPEDSLAADLSLWLPALNYSKDMKKPPLELETCHYIMSHIGGKFCELVQEEREEINKAEDIGRINWKRPVGGVREMCDACETTLFNLHWVCHKCGFGVCSDCYKIRRAMTREEVEDYDGDKSNPHRWIRCSKGKPHHSSFLVPTQIIPSTCLFDLCELAHQARAKWSITSQCRCKKIHLAPRSSDPTPLLKNHFELAHNGSKSATNLYNLSKTDVKPSMNKDNPRFKSYDCENSASPLDWLASIALREQRQNSTIKNLGVACDDNLTQKSNRETSKMPNLNKPPGGANTAPRSWLCNGQLLHLTDSKSRVNVDTFQLHWFYGMPVMASGANNSLTRDLWKPEAFSAEHGDQPTGGALVNCRRGSVITNANLKDFWSGFERIENRLRDEESGEKMILKLKDWPTTDDFIDSMPEKFDDLMRALPLPQYTARDGRYNLAAHLPNFFVRPDLGPKMYIAYGWVSEDDWSQGTTNIHLDISDACNLMVYVGIPSDQPSSAKDALLKIIKEGDVDEVQIARAKSEKAGALWHIFKPADADKIRKMILKVKAENGMVVSEDHDPIHDQQIYLDRTLRMRLKEEYDVEGYALVQCEGDSVFIPAGAPHQVFNLHSCIKVAEDFVSPEHIDKCFKLTEEFRHLSTTHSNHEDKLQLKNIIYHAMKEVVSSLHQHEFGGVASSHG